MISIKNNSRPWEGPRTLVGPKIWELVPEDTKQIKSLEIFKNKIKIWVLSKCSLDYAIFIFKIYVVYNLLLSDEGNKIKFNFLIS